jgi:L-fucose mutarotase/ribose pyranase (RbsD/FucU family)
MLKGLNPLLTPDVLYALCAMGHGDEVVIVDAHYPADVVARSLHRFLSSATGCRIPTLHTRTSP